MTAGTNPERQSDYQETAYEDQAWEIIDEVDENPQFHAMELDVMKSEDFTIDPMFEDYGGETPAKVTKMFHSTDMIEGKKEDLTENLKQEIADLKAAHEQALEAAKETAYEQGKREGKEEATEQRNAAEGMINEAVELLLKDMFAQVQLAIADLEAKSVEFSLDVARKLIGTSVEVNPEYIVPILHDALSHAGTAIIQRVRVSPEDFEFIEVLGVRNVIQQFDGSWDFEADETINSGCVVDTSAGEIDFQLDEAWKRIAEDVVRVVR